MWQLCCSVWNGRAPYKPVLPCVYKVGCQSLPRVPIHPLIDNFTRLSLSLSLPFNGERGGKREGERKAVKIEWTAYVCGSGVAWVLRCLNYATTSKTTTTTATAATTAAIWVRTSSWQKFLKKIKNNKTSLNSTMRLNFYFGSLLTIFF